jgi:hypothetical protein
MTKADDILDVLMTRTPQRLDELPIEQGLYALYDHEGVARYIGVTEMGLRRRIWNYHSSGDNNSHKYSTIYNAGRLFHTRKDPRTDPVDGAIAKELRRLFARERCRAVGYPLPDVSRAELYGLEAQLRRMAPKEALSWNDARALDAFEPKDALDAFLSELDWPAFKIAAIERQAQRWVS